jgi:molybdopterin-containing oxidoreductase family membrane subunit
VCQLEAYITVQHIELMNIVIMITGSIVGCAYITELFIAWYSGVEYEQYAFLNRATGPYWWAYLLMMTCNVVSPQVMWFKKIRTSILVSFIISIVVNVGMWFERFVIIVTSLHRDYLPSSWTMFSPTFVDIGIFIGTIGFFFTLFLLYARTFPVIAQAEVKSILKSSGEKYKKLREAGKPLYEVHTTSRIKEKVVTERSHPVDTNKMEVASLLDRIGVFNAATDTPDNLQKIKGIGPQMEQTLNQIGIYTYAQLSRMNQEEYILLDSITGSFPGRAQRDDWAGQAERLNTNR